MEYNVVSLFAGVGGICLGFEKAEVNGKKYNLLLANEWDEKASITYKNNFDHLLIVEDIRKIFPSYLDEKNEDAKYLELREVMTENYVDILTAGFPCQAFSVAGKPLGFDDKRGVLFLNILEYIDNLERKVGKPRVLFLENVKNLKTHDKGNTYKIIRKKIEERGYYVKDTIINTYKFSTTPQNRERIFMICFANIDDYKKFTMFEKLEDFRLDYDKEKLKNEIEQILEMDVDEKYYYTKIKYPHYYKEGEDKVNLSRDITEKNQFYQLRRGQYVRKNKSNVCPTLTANMGTGGHNVPLVLDGKGIRKLTPEETFKLQGFPVGEGYELPKMYNNRPIGNSHFYKQAGNSVSVPIIKMIATEILKIL